MALVRRKPPPPTTGYPTHGARPVFTDYVDGPEGYSAESVFASGHRYSLDEITLIPGHADHEALADMTTRICKNSPKEKVLQLPFLSAASASVTEANMAIALALQGGVGIIHRNQSIVEQADMVRKVKQQECGFIMDPCIVGPNDTVAEVRRARSQKRCGSAVVTHNGKLGGRLVGLVTCRDIDPIDNPTLKVHAFMTKDVVAGMMRISLSEAKQMLHEKKVGKLPIVNKDNEVLALLCRGDVKKLNNFPKAVRDANSMLMVAAAVGGATDEDFNRAQALIHAGADILVMDVSDTGVTNFTPYMVRKLKEGDWKTADMLEKTLIASDLLVGPITTRQHAKKVLDAGCDGLIVGGPEAYRSEASILYDIAKYARSEFGAPVVADIGAKNVTQVAKAVCLGARAVILDGILEGTDESPGNHYYRDGVRIKARITEEAKPTHNADPLFRVPHPIATGMVSQVVDRGSVVDLLPHLLEGVRRTLMDLGQDRLLTVGANLASGNIRIERLISCPSTSADEHLKLQRLSTSALHNRW